MLRIFDNIETDGRPVVSSRHRGDPVACYRVEQSKLLLNLDFPTFNEDREALYNRIKKLVRRGDDYEPDSPAMENVKEDLLELMDRKSPYSKAAESLATSRGVEVKVYYGKFGNLLAEKRAITGKNEY